MERANARVREVEGATNLRGARARRATQGRVIDDQVVRLCTGIVEPAHGSQHRGVAAATDRTDDPRGSIPLGGPERAPATRPVHVAVERREWRDLHRSAAH